MTRPEDAGLVLLATSPRVAPGLLSWRAWAALHAARRVTVASRAHPLVPALDDAGVAWELVDGDAVERAAALVTLGAGTVHVLEVDGDEDLLASLTDVPDATVVLGSWDLPGARLLDLVAVMDRLRSPGGCPWDAQQTHASLVEYLVEEAYETVEAIETDDDDALREELGDLLLQVAFHARIAQEHDVPWSVDDVADGIVAKLVSRHPHVFGDVDADTAEQVEANWEKLKSAEKKRESVTDGIPLALPSLVLAAKLLKRSARVDVAVAHPVVAAAADAAYDAVDGDEGDLLLALVARMRDADIDADQALRAAARSYRARVRAAEGLGS